MKSKFIKLLPLVALFTLSGCSLQQTNGKKNVDPFMIGDNLDAVSLVEAQLIASEAYNNLSYVSTVSKEINTYTDTTSLYVGSLADFAEQTNKVENYNVEYFKNQLTRKYKFSENKNNTQVGKSVEEKSNEMTEWYNFKKESTTDYSLYSRTKTLSNGAEWVTYSITNENFADVTNLTPSWNKYLIKNAEEYSDVSIHYSEDMSYVRDGMHILGYKTSKSYVSNKSPIAPDKEDVSLLTETNNISIVAYVKKDGIGWITESVAVKTTISVLNNLSGVSVDPIVLETNESVAKYTFVAEHESKDIPEYKEDTSGDNPIFIANFDTENYEFASTIAQLSNNDEYYRQIEVGYNGRAFYTEKYLTEGFYSIYDKVHASLDEPVYEVWGFDDIINNRCPSFVQDGNIEEHDKFFKVTKAGVYSFDIVFDKEMKNITTFTVAKMG